jgi:hypothetical protein
VSGCYLVSGCYDDASMARSRPRTGDHAERILGDVNPLAGAAADIPDLTIRPPGLSTAERSVGHRHMPGRSDLELVAPPQDVRDVAL